MVKVREAVSYADILERLKRQVMEQVRAGSGHSEIQGTEENRQAQTKEGESTT